LTQQHNQLQAHNMPSSPFLPSLTHFPSSLSLPPPLSLFPPGLGGGPASTYSAEDGYYVLSFSSHVERLQVCKALASNAAINPGCTRACRVGCCLPHLLSDTNSQANRSPGDCTNRYVPHRMAPVEVRFGLHEECRASCLAACGFARPSDLRWDILRVVPAPTLKGPQKSTSSSSSTVGIPAGTQSVLKAMSSVVATSLPTALPPPKKGLLGKKDPACGIPGYTHLPGVLPSVVGGPLQVNLIGKYTTSTRALSSVCSSNPRCVFFTTTGHAVGLYQNLLGGLTPADTVGEPFGVPVGGWSANASRLQLPGWQSAAALRLRYNRMPHCEGRCCGTYVVNGALRWQRVVAPPGQEFSSDAGAPPFPANIFRVGDFTDTTNWWLDTSARAKQCSILRQPASGLRFPFCTVACKRACCAPDLPLVTPYCSPQRYYTRGCAMVVRQAYEQCTRQVCEKQCGFHLVSRCTTAGVCPSGSFAAARGTWRMTRARGGRVRAARRSGSLD
jgi:hypothetical protein